MQGNRDKMAQELMDEAEEHLEKGHSPAQMALEMEAQQKPKNALYALLQEWEMRKEAWVCENGVGSPTLTLDEALRSLRQALIDFEEEEELKRRK